MSKATLPEGPLALIHGDDDFAVSRRARQINQGWCEAMGGEDHEIVEASAANAGEAVRALGRLREPSRRFLFLAPAKSFGARTVISWVMTAPPRPPT